MRIILAEVCQDKLIINILFYEEITRRNEGLVCYINKLYNMHTIIWREKD